MKSPHALLIVCLLIPCGTVFSQSQNDTKVVGDADSLYIRTFIKPNDIRVFYGAQGNRMVLGSLQDGSPDLGGNLYRNTNDFLGVGLTYKWIDGDLYFSLPGTTYLKEERSNLDQFKLSTSHTRRKIGYRAYLANSTGVIVSGNNDEYESDPSMHEFQMGVQATYVFNNRCYSYRAALFQSEEQVKTAGSFLLRGEVFYRSLGGSGQHIVPDVYDVVSRFGSQTGMTYLKAPGLLVMPGYGINVAIPHTKFFISPMMLAGLGAAFNTYKSDNGRREHVNMEYSGTFLLNAGYNGGLLYGRLQFNYSASYSPIQPAYLTSVYWGVSLWVGLRFRDLHVFTSSRKSSKI